MVSFIVLLMSAKEMSESAKARISSKMLIFYYSGSLLKDTISGPDRQQKFPTELVSRGKIRCPLSGIRIKSSVH
jgi:hypothetical protein